MFLIDNKLTVNINKAVYINGKFLISAFCMFNLNFKESLNFALIACSI